MKKENFNDNRKQHIVAKELIEFVSFLFRLSRVMVPNNLCLTKYRNDKSPKPLINFTD
jgi:hypothetical protein